jgi:hypothetical protein
LMQRSDEHNERVVPGLCFIPIRHATDDSRFPYIRQPAIDRWVFRIVEAGEPIAATVS